MSSSLQRSRSCESCGVGFVQRHHVERLQRFCSRACNARVHLKRAIQIGSLNPNWKGGVSDDAYAYKLVQMERFPHKVAARKAVYAAVKRGVLVRPGLCEDCGVACMPHGHHSDYSFPLSVNWLCLKCHRRAHEVRQC